MPSVYLQEADYANYGVPAATSQQVIQASIIIDGYIQRPEGLLYTADANGNPCYMTAKTPSYSLTVAESITAGTNVVVNVAGGVLQVQIGEVAILDRANTDVTEACIIIAISGNALTLQTVQFDHEASAILDFGMTIFEDKQMPSGRPMTTLSRWPLLMLLSGRGRYGYGRRGSCGNFAVNEYNLLAAITSFGGPPIWEVFNAGMAGVDPTTANVWAPSGVLLAYYTQIQFWYIAGWTYANLPPEIKQSCANIINAVVNNPIYGNIKSMKAGDTAIEFGRSSYVDDESKNMLGLYKTRCFI